MEFQPIYHNDHLLLPRIELPMGINQAVGILTDVRRKQLLLDQIIKQKDVYVFQTKQGEYMRLTVTELIQFLQRISQKKQDVNSLLDYFALKEERNVKLRDLVTSKRMYITLLRVFFAHQSTLVLEEPYFYLEEQDRRHFKRILDDLAREKQVLILTSNLEDALISCHSIHRLSELGLQQLDIQDSEDEKQEELPQGNEPVNITMQKISTRRNDKVILFNPPEIDYIESIEGSIIVHVGGDHYDCAMTLAELEQRLQSYGFFRCHRSYLVNLQKVREIITWTKNSYSLRLSTGKDAVVPLSRSKLQELKTLLNI